MSGKELKTIYFLKGYNADNSHLIFLGQKKQQKKKKTKGINS